MVVAHYEGCGGLSTLVINGGSLLVQGNENGFGLLRDMLEGVRGIGKGLTISKVWGSLRMQDKVLGIGGFSR